MSTKTKWTPGPWRKGHRNNNDAMITFHGVIVGNIFVEAPTANEEADANLMAAAPELYDSVSLAIELVEQDVIRVRPSERERLMAALSKWNAAAAKARGES